MYGLGFAYLTINHPAIFARMGRQILLSAPRASRACVANIDENCKSSTGVEDQTATYTASIKARVYGLGARGSGLGFEYLTAKHPASFVRLAPRASRARAREYS